MRDEQVTRALGRLEERGELTPHRRAAIEELADRLVADLLALFETDERVTGRDDSKAGDEDGEFVLLPR